MLITDTRWQSDEETTPAGCSAMLRWNTTRWIKLTCIFMLKGHIYYAFWMLKGDNQTDVLAKYVRGMARPWSSFFWLLESFILVHYTLFLVIRVRWIYCCSSDNTDFALESLELIRLFPWDLLKNMVINSFHHSHYVRISVNSLPFGALGINMFQM